MCTQRELRSVRQTTGKSQEHWLPGSVRTSNVFDLQFFNITGQKYIHHFSCRTLRKSPVTTSNKRQHSPIGSWLYPILTPQPIISQWAFHSVKELCTISTQLSWPSIARYGFHKGDFLYCLNSWKTNFKNATGRYNPPDPLGIFSIYQYNKCFFLEFDLTLYIAKSKSGGKTWSF